WQLVVVRPEPPGQYTAQVVGIPEVRATAATEEAAIEQARQILAEGLATARWGQGERAPRVKSPGGGHPWHKDPYDPLEQEFLEELARNKREDLERTLQEYDQECSNSSSTPTI